MNYTLINATAKDIDYLKKVKTYNIMEYAHDLSKEEITQINKYVEESALEEIKDLKLIIDENNKTIGCILVSKKDEPNASYGKSVDRKYGLITLPVFSKNPIDQTLSILYKHKSR